MFSSNSSTHTSLYTFTYMFGWTTLEIVIEVIFFEWKNEPRKEMIDRSFNEHNDEHLAVLKNLDRSHIFEGFFSRKQILNMSSHDFLYTFRDHP